MDSKTALFQITTEPHTSWVTLGTFPAPTEPQHPHFHAEGRNSSHTFAVCSES